MILERRLNKIKAMLDKKQPTLELFLDDVSSSQNNSAILRTADAVGILRVYYAVKNNHSAKIHPTITQGSERWVYRRRINYNERIEFLKQKKSEGFSLAVTAFDESSINFREYDYTKPTIVVMGNEKEGVSKEVEALADSKIIIPMMGMAQSLNVSVATAIILYEAQRQRFEAGMYDKRQLSNEEYEKILEQIVYKESIAKRSKGAIEFTKRLWLDW
jgi:tRNA (guanosine-2'-O-)-methyltransferase